MRTSLSPEVDRRVEAWFVSRGLPHLIPSYSASRDVLTRAAPLLVVVFVVECVTAVREGSAIWLNAVIVLAGFGVALGAWAGLNRLRRRPTWARPDRVGAPELVAFVVVPALTRWVLHESNPLRIIGGNLALVVAIYGGTSYGVVPLARWAFVRLGRQFQELVALLARALPLLLLAVTFFFLTGVVWQLVGGLYGPSYWLTLALFAAVGVIFVLLRVPLELAQLSKFETWADVRRELAGTPLEHEPFAGIDPPVVEPPTTRERANAMLILVFSQGVQTLAVVAMIFGFLTLFGIVAMQPSTVENYILREPHLLAEWTLLGERSVSEELLRVVGFLAAFSGLYFTVVGLTDQLFRAEFVESVLKEIRQAMAVRAAHRLLRSADQLGATGPG